MRSLKSISTNSISILLPLYSHKSVLVSGTFLDEATGSRGDEQDGNFIVNEIKNKYKIQALFVKVNLSNVKECKKLISETVNYFGCINGLINYAGILPVSSIIDTEENLFDEVFNINIKGAFFCTKFAIIAMLENVWGSIVNIGSLHAYGGDEDRAAYSVSKGALFTLTKHVAKNFAKYNIRANWITIDWVATPGEIALRKNRQQYESHCQSLD